MGIVLGIFGVAMVLLASNRVRIDVIGLGILLALGLTRTVPEATLFGGFASQPVLVIAGMLAMGEGLVRSGLTTRMARWIHQWGGTSESRLGATLMILAGLPSAFISDVGLVGLFIPVVKAIHQRSHVPVRTLLLPLAVAAALGGLLTMVGSAGNIVGNQALRQAGDPVLGIFAITPLALILLVIGVIFMVVVGRRLIRPGPAPLESYDSVLHAYVSEVRVLPHSGLVGQPLHHSGVFSDAGLTVAQIYRNTGAVPATGDTVLAANDVLVIVGSVQSILDSGNPHLGLQLLGDTDDGPHLRASGGLTVMELLIGHRSRWAGRSLVDLDVRRRWGIGVLGLYRQGQLVHQHVARVVLRVGDILLVEGSAAQMAMLPHEPGLIVLNAPPVTPLARPYQVWAAPLVLLTSLLLAAFGVLGLRLAIAGGILALTALKVLPLSEAYRAIEWRILVFVAGMLPLGQALIHTGVTQEMVNWLSGVAQVLHSGSGLLALLFILAALLTQVLSNIATVVVLAPVAIGVAHHLHWAVDPFVLAVIIAVSAVPLTPLANKVDLLVMGPGGYTYGDFLRVGWILSLVMLIVTIGMVPVFFPLH
jgi:di/tricarboxylate transporter